MINTKRIYMNEEGSSPGGGSAPPAPAAPTAAPTAPGSPAQPQPQYVTKADLEAFGNGLFANFRKAGLLKKDEPAPTPPQSPTATAPAPTGLSMADVEAMLERERVITRVATEHKLTDKQVTGMKRLLSAEKPEDVSAWVSSFVTDMGLVRPTEPAQPPTPLAGTPPIQPPSGPPLSDKGSPAPGGVVNWEREFAENPGFMSTAARAAMDAKYGAAVARKMRIDAVNAPGGQGDRLRVTVK